MNIAICDDEKIYVDKIAEIILQKASEKDVECNFFRCYSGQQLIEICKKENIDAVFLDVAMPGIDGFETAEQLHSIESNICIVFVSANEAVVFESYKYDPVWFVPKSGLGMLEDAINKIFDRVNYYHRIGLKKTIKIEGNKVIEIDLTEIAFIKTDDHYIKIVFKDNTESESYRSKIEPVENQLSDNWFVRVHNRFLVNCRMISFFDAGYCILHNGIRIPVSRSKITHSKEIFHKYMRMI